MLKVFHIEFVLVTITIVADDFLADEDDHEEEVEVCQTVVGSLSCSVDVKEEL